MTKKEKLDKESAKLSEEFTKLKVEHATEETKLKTKKQTSQNMLEENIKTYDLTMEEKHHEKSEIENELNKLREEADTLIQLFKEIDAERKREEELEQEFKLKKEVRIGYFFISNK